MSGRMLRSGVAIIIVALVAAAAACPAHAGRISWAAPISGTFQNEEMWTPKQVPGPSDVALFGGAPPYTVFFYGMPGALGAASQSVGATAADVTLMLRGAAYGLGHTGGVSLSVDSPSGAKLSLVGGSVTAQGEAVVGFGGSGELSLDSNAMLTSQTGTLGDGSGASGTASVEGQWTGMDLLTVGDAGQGQLSLSGSGWVVAKRAVLGSQAHSVGRASLDGADTGLVIDQWLTVGREGEGSLSIDRGGVVVGDPAGGTAGAVAIGAAEGSRGEVLVGGSPSAFLMTLGAGGEPGGIAVGQDGRGSLTVQDGASVTTDQLGIGLRSSTPSGLSPKCTLGIGGGTVDVSGDMFVAIGPRAKGEVNVGASSASGPSELRVGGELQLAKDGGDIASVAQLDIQLGGQVTSAGALVGGEHGFAEVAITGDGSTWTVGGGMAIAQGNAAVGHVTVAGDGAELRIGGALLMGAGGAGANPAPHGVLTIREGGTLTSVGAVLGDAGGLAEAEVRGHRSLWTISGGDLVLGEGSGGASGGRGDLKVLEGGQVVVSGGSATVGKVPYEGPPGQLVTWSSISIEGTSAGGASSTLYCAHDVYVGSSSQDSFGTLLLREGASLAAGRTVVVHGKLSGRDSTIRAQLVDNQGLLEVGGSLTIDGDFVTAERVRLNVSSATENDELLVAGTAKIDGVVRVEVPAHLEVPEGATFDIIEAVRLEDEGFSLAQIQPMWSPVSNEEIYLFDAAVVYGDTLRLTAVEAARRTGPVQQQATLCAPGPAASRSSASWDDPSQWVSGEVPGPSDWVMLDRATQDGGPLAGPVADQVIRGMLMTGSEEPVELRLGTGALTSILGTTLTESAILSGTGRHVGTVHNAGGIVGPGASPGILTIVGDYYQEAEGTLGVEIGDTEPDLLAVTGGARLDGTLLVGLLDDAQFALGDVFDVLTAQNVFGTFANEILPLSPLGQPLFSVAYLDDRVRLTALSGSDGVDAIPEPTTLALLGLGGLGALRRRRRRITSRP